MDGLLLATLLVTGFVGCAEFASVALVHPVVRRLPVESQLVMEQGLLRTYGIVMPFGMTAAAVTGYAVIRRMLQLIGRIRLSHFAVYSFVMGMIAMAGHFLQ